MPLSDEQAALVRESYPEGVEVSGDQTLDQAKALAVAALRRWFAIAGMDEPEPSEDELLAELDRLAEAGTGAGKQPDPVVRGAPPERVAHLAGQVSDEWVDAGRAADVEDPAFGREFWEEVRSRLAREADEER